MLTQKFKSFIKKFKMFKLFQPKIDCCLFYLDWKKKQFKKWFNGLIVRNDKYQTVTFLFTHTHSDTHKPTHPHTNSISFIHTNTNTNYTFFRKKNINFVPSWAEYFQGFVKDCNKQEFFKIKQVSQICLREFEMTFFENKYLELF